MSVAREAIAILEPRWKQSCYIASELEPCLPRFEYISGAALFTQARDRIGRDNEETESEFLATFINADVLILSDPVPPGAALSDYQRNLLYAVIDGRYRSVRPTWVTINCDSGAEAEARIGTAAADRLRDGSLTIHCNWPSHRRAAG
jgi:DNA replication protein DnaC